MLERISSLFISAGVLLIILPFFGLTLRNFEEFSYPESFVMALIMIALGSFLRWIKRMFDNKK